MVGYSVVIDTNVLVAALRSSRGASFRLLMQLGSKAFDVYISVPLILEYEDAVKRLIGEIPLTEQEIDDILDYICAVARHQELHYLWRPTLRDPKDEMVLELAVAARCDYVITYNLRDFEGIDRFGVEALTPHEFLQQVGER
jgi:putative PIN family toxin of toxin-antitoxin system